MNSQVLKPNRFEAILAVFALMAMTLGFEPCRAEAKSESLQYLQQLRTQNVKRLEEIDRTLRTTVANVASADLDRSVNTLRATKREHILREELLNRLIFQIDTRYGGGDMREFLASALNSMAAVDATSLNETGLLKFLKYCSEAVQKIPEKNENILAFVEGYMSRSVSNPILPQDYLAQRNYTNGSQSESGSPLSPEEAGAMADQRLVHPPVEVKTN